MTSYYNQTCLSTKDTIKAALHINQMVQTNIPVNEALCKTAAETETFLMPGGMEVVLVCNTQLTYCWNIPHNEKLLNDTLLTLVRNL